MRKKAILMDEVVNITIAVLAIAILVGLAVLVYNIFQQKHERDQAQGQLNDIIAKIEKISKDGGQFTQLYTNPAGWSLVYYDIQVINNNPSQNKIPRVCSFKNCLCLCKGVEKDKYSSQSVALCQKDKVCSYVSPKVFPELPLKIEKTPATLLIQNINQDIVISIKNE